MKSGDSRSRRVVATRSRVISAIHAMYLVATATLLAARKRVAKSRLPAARDTRCPSVVRTHLLGVLLISLLGAIGSSVAHATETAATLPPLALTPLSSVTPLGPYLSYYHDREGDLTLPTAHGLQVGGYFLPLPRNRSAFGFQPGAFWLHASLINRDSQQPDWILVQTFALSDRVDIYLRYPDGRRVHMAGGDSVPFTQRHLRYRHPNFRLHLPADTPVELLVRVQTQSSMQVPFTLYSPKGFFEFSENSQLLLGIYYGILGALFFYNLVMWLSVRDASYLWYVLHLLAIGTAVLTFNGLGFEYLWPESTWMAEKSVPLSICLAQAAMQQFARHFLGLKRLWPWGNHIGLALIGGFLAVAAISLCLSYRDATQAALVAVFANVLWSALEIGVALRRGYKPARLFLLAWAMLLGGSLLFIAGAFGYVRQSTPTDYSIQLGSALEMLLLSVALGHRYASLRGENERMVRDAHRELERKVENRTVELRNALGQLEYVHGRLRESSERDGLTGLHNRSHFREGFEKLLDLARDHRRPLSLLMIDLDYFKLVNDRYGHLVGDDCLRHAAKVVGQTLRPHSALVARFGGEEFIVALPGMDLRAAARVAEDVRRRLHAQPCRSSEHEIPMTASIGVHMIDTGLASGVQTGIDHALQLADAALYRAKAAGRNCVHTSIRLTA